MRYNPKGNGYGVDDAFAISGMMFFAATGAWYTGWLSLTHVFLLAVAASVFDIFSRCCCGRYTGFKMPPLMVFIMFIMFIMSNVSISGFF